MRESQCGTGMSGQFGRAIVYGENSVQWMLMRKIDNGLYRIFDAGKVQAKWDMPVIGQCLRKVNSDNHFKIENFGSL